MINIFVFLLINLLSLVATSYLFGAESFGEAIFWYIIFASPCLLIFLDKAK